MLKAAAAKEISKEEGNNHLTPSSTWLWLKVARGVFGLYLRPTPFALLLAQDGVFHQTRSLELQELALLQETDSSEVYRT
jgi:hypothetical protein